MEYNAIFLRKRPIAIFYVMFFLTAIVLIMPSYAGEKVKMIEGIITHVSDNNSITVKGQSYNVNKALIVNSKGTELSKRQLKTGLKVQIYLHGNTANDVVVFEEYTPE